MKIKIFKLIQISTIVIFLFIGCAEKPIYKLKSLEDNIDLYRGKEIVSKTSQDVETTLEFEDLTPDNYIFYLQVYNSERKVVRLQPKNIYMEIFTKFESSNSNKNGFYNKSINPEIVLKSIDRDMEDRKDLHNVSTGLNLLGTFFSVAVDIASNSEDKTENVISDIFVGVGNQVNEEINYEDDIKDMNSEKYFWRTEVLRKTTLHQGEEIGGLVFFPRLENAKIIKVYIPIGRTLHTYFFEQVRIN